MTRSHCRRQIGAIGGGRRSITGVVTHGVPIVVPSHRPPGRSVAIVSVSDVRDRWDRERDGAGDGRRSQRDGSGRVYRATGEAGVLDELQIHQIAVLCGGGRWLFEVS